MGNSAWKVPDDFEELCVKALLAHGPVPLKGWRRFGDSPSIFPSGGEARKFRQDVLEFFWDIVWERFEDKYTTGFNGNLARFYTNEFMKWVRREQSGPETKDA